MATTNTNSNIVKIHGKDYITVAGRVQLAHKKGKPLSIQTEVLPVPNQVVVRAIVTTDKGTFTGISAANPSKMIEKISPYEVAETSAVGRALGFAGFGELDSIATADEVLNAQSPTGNKGGSTATSSDIAAICTCGTKGKYHAKDCPARLLQEQKT